jgi:hypothetical protein
MSKLSTDFKQLSTFRNSGLGFKPTELISFTTVVLLLYMEDSVSIKTWKIGQLIELFSFSG